MFANALRTHTRLRVLTATRITTLPATRNITSLVAFRTAVPKNVSLSASRSFTTSQIAREESQVAPKELEDSQVTPEGLEESQVASAELKESQVASAKLEESQVASAELEESQVASAELEESQVASAELEESQVAPETLENSQVPPKEPGDSQVARNLEDGAPSTLLDAPSSTIFVGNIRWKTKENGLRKLFSQFGEVEDVRMRAYFFLLAVFFQLCFS